MSDDKRPVKLTIVLTDRYKTEHKGEITLAPHETVDAFLKRAAAMLEELRADAP